MQPKSQIADVSSLVQLVHHRWNIPILAVLAKNSGAKFVSLANALQVSRPSLSASLTNLIELGLVHRNTGYGHPMRPEYLLTEAGEAIGEQCIVLNDVVKRSRAADLAYRKWTLPLLAVMGEDARRFSELNSALRNATPRAITLGLKSIVGENWATRTLINDYPPAAAYQLMPKGQRILSSASGLY